MSAAESAAVSAWLSKFEAALSKSDAKAAAALFADECYWRDLVSFTWNIITLEGRAAIEAMLKETLGQGEAFQLENRRRSTARPMASSRAGSPLKRRCRAGAAFFA